MTYTPGQREALRKYLAALDKAIGELTTVRYDLAAELLASESAELDSKRRASEHYAALAEEVARIDWDTLDDPGAA